MQESWELKLQNTGAIDKDIEKVIQQLFVEEQKDLGIFLSYYYRSQGAIVEKVKCLQIQKSKEPEIGKIYAGFELVYFNACLSIHEKEPEQIILDYKMDLSNKKMVLTGPYWPEREPDEI